MSALAWLPDGSGFISGSLDKKIIHWVCFVSQPYDVALNLMPSQDADGKQRDSWGLSPIRVTDLTVTPDFTRLVAVGMYDAPATVPGPTAAAPENGSQTGAGRSSETRVIVYDLATKQPLS